MPTIRNPLAGFGLTILGASVLSFLVGLPIRFLPEPELMFFYLPFALFGIGAFAGRTTFLGTLGFVGGTIGAFVGIYAFQTFFPFGDWPLWPADLGIVLNVGFAGICGLGGLTAGKLGARRIDRLSEHAPKMRRCLKCGAKVGMAARKCWSCRSYLPPT